LGCQAGQGRKVFESPDGDYCFAYPERFELQQPDYRGMALGLIGPPLDASGDPLRATLGISVEELPAGGSLEQVIDQVIADRAVPALPQPIRDTVQLGGEPAFKVGVLPGLPGSEIVFALHNDRIYQLVFEPPARDWPVAADEVTELYNVVMMSFMFLR
jgi:hypothetical protein